MEFDPRHSKQRLSQLHNPLPMAIDDSSAKRSEFDSEASQNKKISQVDSIPPRSPNQDSQAICLKEYPEIEDHRPANW